MTLRYKTGCAVTETLSNNNYVLLNCVNCQGKYASGIAKTIRDKVPQSYQDYLEFYGKYSKSRDMLGEFYWKGQVIHIAGQEYYGYDKKRYVNYAALSKALYNIFVEAMPFKGIITFVIPYYMCCGLAGGDWEIVLELIEYFLKDFNVVIYKLEG